MVVGEIAVETDVVVIGGGPGGYAAAIRLGQLGQSVVLIEEDKLGGVCLNRGCIPSKALIHSAGEFHKLPQLGKMGIRMTTENFSFRMREWQEWKSGIVTQLNKGIEHLCKENGVTLVKGKATFLSDDRIGVETGGDFETYKFQHAIIATGSRPFIPPIIEIDHIHILDSSSILQLEQVPESLSIIGGGYIGMELGMAFAKLGCKVIIVEMADRILPQVSADLVREVTRSAKKLGMVLKTSTKVDNVSIDNDRAILHVSSERSGQETLQCEKVLVTIGRAPNSKGLGLEQAGVQVNEQGYIPVDDTCRTNRNHIYAIGDVTPGPSLAHRASKQGMVAAEVISGLSSAYDSPFVPYVIFTEPQIAGVGFSKEEAEQRGFEVKKGQFPYRANGRALATAEVEGFAEVIVDANTHLLLGLHIVGADASNMIGEGVLALELSARVEDLALTMHPHPTLSEVWLEAAEAALGHAIHIVNK